MWLVKRTQHSGLVLYSVRFDQTNSLQQCLGKPMVTLQALFWLKLSWGIGCTCSRTLMQMQNLLGLFVCDIQNLRSVTSSNSYSFYGKILLYLMFTNVQSSCE